MKCLRSAAGGPGSWLPATGLLLMGLLIWVGAGPVATGQGAPGASAQLAESPWPKYRKDALHTGRSPHAGPTSGQLKWTFSTGKRDAEGGIETVPVIGLDGTVYVGANNGILYALDPDAGEIRWVFPTDFETFAIYSTPAVDRSGIVHFGAKDGHVYAVRAPRRGLLAEVVWSLNLGTTIETSPTFTPDGTLVIGADDWAYYGIEPPRGGQGAKVKWRFQTGGTLISSPAADARGTVIVASMDGKVYAFHDTKRREPAQGPLAGTWHGAYRDRGGTSRREYPPRRVSRPGLPRHDRRQHLRGRPLIGDHGLRALASFASGVRGPRVTGMAPRRDGKRLTGWECSSVALNAQQGILYLALKSDNRVIPVRVRDIAGE